MSQIEVQDANDAGFLTTAVPRDTKLKLLRHYPSLAQAEPCLDPLAGTFFLRRGIWMRPRSHIDLEFRSIGDRSGNQSKLLRSSEVDQTDQPHML